MKTPHVLDVLSEATRLSSNKLEDLIKQNNDDIVVSSQKEVMRIQGVDKVIRRVYVRTSYALEYATVGWVRHEDIDLCMTCLKPFWFFQGRMHCHACGSINCNTCAASFCLVKELPDQTHGVPVCSHCNWGQDIVSGWHQQEEMVTPPANTKAEVVVIPPKVAQSDITNINKIKDTMKMSSSVLKSDNNNNSNNNSTSNYNSTSNNNSTTSSSSTTTTTTTNSSSTGTGTTNNNNINNINNTDSSNTTTKNTDKPDPRKQYSASRHGVATPSSPTAARTQSGSAFAASRQAQGQAQENACISSDDEEFLSMQTVVPLFVIKTKRTKGSTAKVFVNVCTLPEVDLLTAVAARRGLFLNGKIPVESIDKVGETCLIYDVFVNTLSTSELYYDMDSVSEWIERVGGELIKLLNTECNESLDLTLKFPKTKQNYKGDVIKPFTSVKKRPSGAPRHQGLGSKIPPPKKGWLKKQRRGGMIKNWKARYFVLFGGELRYFEDALDTPPYGEMEKGNMDLTGADLEDKEGLQFYVVGKQGVEKNLLLEAEDIHTKLDWVKAIHQHIAYLDAK